MSYHGLKRQMNLLIDRTLDGGEVDVSKIYFVVDTKFGLGKLSVDRRLKILEDTGLVEINDNKVKKV